MKVFKNRTTRFLTTSLVCVIFLCVLVFSSLAFHMNKESTQTINQVGTMYMSNMSQQISMHFSTTISLRLDPAAGNLTPCTRSYATRHGRGILTIWAFTPPTAPLKCFTETSWRSPTQGPS